MISVKRYRSKMPPVRARERFFYITDLFRLTRKDWAKLLNELDSMTLEERDELLHGREDEPYRGYER